MLLGEEDCCGKLINTFMGSQFLIPGIALSSFVPWWNDE